MIRLTAQRDVEGFDVDRVKYPLLEFIPCTRVNVNLGPPVVITVPGHDPDELASDVLSRVEDIIGCALTVDALPG